MCKGGNGVWKNMYKIEINHLFDLNYYSIFIIKLLVKMANFSVPILVSLEGNIGAGKSTLLEALSQRLSGQPEWLFLREPVHIWDEIRDSEGTTVLSKFYANPAKYAFAFQIMAYTTRLHELRRLLRENPQCRGVICERSLDADKHIFAKMLHSDGLIEDVMYNIYERFFNEYEDMYKVSGIIYVDADPEVCNQRIIKRSRDGETNITLEYLTKCRDYHSVWLLDTPTSSTGSTRSSASHNTMLHLDTNRVATFDLDDPNDVGHLWLNKVEEFLESLHQ